MLTHFPHKISHESSTEKHRRRPKSTPITPHIIKTKKQSSTYHIIITFHFSFAHTMLGNPLNKKSTSIHNREAED